MAAGPLQRHYRAFKDDPGNLVVRREPNGRVGSEGLTFEHDGAWWDSTFMDEVMIRGLDRITQCGVAGMPLANGTQWWRHEGWGNELARLR